MLKDEIKEDLLRAKKALDSAERNFKEDDIFTVANRAFVACENSVYVILKSKFGSTSVSRMKILTRLKETSPEAKKAYDDSYVGNIPLAFKLVDEVRCPLGKVVYF